MATNKSLLSVLLVLFSIAIYYNALSSGFVFDDRAQVLENPWITGPEHIGKIFFSSAWAYDDIHGETDLYRPMLHLTYMVEYALFGRNNPFWWHAFNVGLHALNVLVVFFLSQAVMERVFKKTQENVPDKTITAFIAALLFAAHPINTEVVAWVACITELTFTFFLLISFYSYTRLEKTATSARRVIYSAISLTAFFLAALSKETAVVLPVFLALYDLADGNGKRNFKFKNYVLYLVVAVAYMLLRSIALGGGAVRELYVKDPVLQLATIFPLLAGYFQKLLLPVNLSPSYPLRYAGSLFDPVVIASILIVAVVTALLWRYARRTPALRLIAGIIILPIMPTFYQLFYDPDVYFVSMPSDRYLYLPSVGFAMLVALGLARVSMFWQFKRGAGAVTAIVLSLMIVVPYAVASASRSKIWKDDLALWTRAKADYPNNYFPRYMLAEIYAERGVLEKARDEAIEVVRLRPALASAHHRLGLIYHALGMVDEALAEFKEVLRTHPENRDAHYNVGLIYLWRGRPDEAIMELTAAVESSVNTSGANRARVALGRAYMGAGRTKEAEHALKETLRLDPTDKEARALLESVIIN